MEILKFLEICASIGFKLPIIFRWTKRNFHKSLCDMASPGKTIAGFICQVSLDLGLGLVRGFRLSTLAVLQLYNCRSLFDTFLDLVD
jgi:hypothetical protein